MDDIRRISTLLTSREQQAFLRYLDVERVRLGRVDADIFLAVTQAETGIKSPRATDKRNAYHQNRKRLLGKLSEYLVVRSLQEDVTGEARVNALLAMSRLFMENNVPDTAWKYLQKALRTAEKKELHDAVNRVCMQMLDFSEHAPPGFDLKQVLKKKIAAEKNARTEENIRIATSFVRHRLNEVKRTGRIGNFQVYLDRMLERFEVTEAVFEKPRYLYNIVNIVRDSYLALRDITHFESFVIDRYEKTESQFGFKKQDHGYKLNFLYMIAHALYRNRKYKESLEWTEKLRYEMKRYDRVYYAAWNPRYVSLYSMLMALTGENEKAIALHRHMLESEREVLSPLQRYNMQLNLAWFYVNAGKHRETNRVLVRQEPDLAEMTRVMGKEWMMRRQLMFALNQYELSNEDIALQSLADIRLRYADLLAHDVYRKVVSFLTTCEKFMRNPFVFSQREKKEIMRRDMEMFSLEREENKSLAYYAWIISKMEGTRYYETVLETVKWKPL